MEEFIQGISRLELLKRGAVGAAALGGMDALVRAESAAAAEEALTARAGGKLVVGIGQVFEDINVLTAFGYRWGQLMAYAMYDTLVKYDRNGRAVPLLARSWTHAEPDDDDRQDPPGRQVPQRQPDARRGRRLEPQPHPRPGQAGLEQLPRAAQGHLGQGRQDRQRDPSHHDQEADPDGRELAVLVHHAGERRRPESRRAARSAPGPSSTRTSSRATGSSSRGSPTTGTATGRT